MSRTTIEERNEKLDIPSMKPYGDFILVEEILREKTAGGIYYTERSGERTPCSFGKVIAVGQGEENPVTGERYPLGVKRGDIVITMQYIGEKIHARMGKYRLLREHGIWATIKMDENLDITEVKPYGAHILLSMEGEEKTLSGALFLPSNPATQFRMAKVVEVGPGKRHLKSGYVEHPGVKHGDKVVALRYAGANLTMNKQEYRLASSEDLQAILED